MKAMCKAYLAAKIFDRSSQMYNKKIAKLVRQAYPGIDLYLAQENKSINNKDNFAPPSAIYDGDMARLRESDILITVISGDTPGIGSSTEIAAFSQMIEYDKSRQRRILAIYDDTRDMTLTDFKYNYEKTHIANNSTPYVNLLLVGFIEKYGIIVNNEYEAADILKKWFKEDKEKNISGIYCISNKTSGKQYIGCSNNIWRRMKEHYSGRDVDNSLIDRNIQKYGPENFEVTILEECEPNKIARQEIYWVNKLNTVIPNGYNIAAPGGLPPIRLKQISAYDLEGNLIKTFSSIKEGGEYFNISSQCIIGAATDKDYGSLTAAGMLWAYGSEEKIQGIDIDCLHLPKTIYKYDLITHKLLQEYSPISDAEREYETKHIYAAARGERNSCRNFIWSYEKYERIPDNYRKLNYKNHHQLQPVWLVDIKSGAVNNFDDIIDIADNYNISLNSLANYINTLETCDLGARYLIFNNAKDVSNVIDLLESGTTQFNKNKNFVTMVLYNNNEVIKITNTYLRNKYGVTQYDVSNIKKRKNAVKRGEYWLDTLEHYKITIGEINNEI